MDFEQAFQRFYERVYASASQRGGLLREEDAAQHLPGELLERAVAEGRLTRPAPGLLRLSIFQPLEDERALIALLRTQPGGALSRQSALAQWRLCEPGPVVHLSYPTIGFEDLVAPDGVRVHFEDVPQVERAWREGVQVTTVERALADCSREGVDEALLSEARRRARRLKLIIDRTEQRPESVDASLRAALLRALDADDDELPFEVRPLEALRWDEGEPIRDLRGLEYYSALEVLDLRCCDLVRNALVPLSSLPFLRVVHLRINSETDLTPLENCAELGRVRLEGFDEKAHAAVRARLEARGVLVDLTEGTHDASPFEDPNLKLAVLEELEFQGLLEVPQLIAIDELELDVPHFRRVVSLPLSAEQLAAVTELRWSLGGQKLQHLVWPQYDGESDDFAIRSLAGLEALPNLKLLELDGMGREEAFDQQQLTALRARGVDVRLLGIS